MVFYGDVEGGFQRRLVPAWERSSRPCRLEIRYSQPPATFQQHANETVRSSCTSLPRSVWKSHASATNKSRSSAVWRERILSRALPWKFISSDYIVQHDSPARTRIRKINQFSDRSITLSVEYLEQSFVLWLHGRCVKWWNARLHLQWYALRGKS